MLAEKREETAKEEGSEGDKKNFNRLIIVTNLMEILK